MKSNDKNQKKCEICESEATCLCITCQNYFCDSCFKLIHDKEKNSKHQQEQIDPYVPINLKCSIHSKNPLNLFCLEEKGKYNYIYNIYMFNII